MITGGRSEAEGANDVPAAAGLHNGWLRPCGPQIGMTHEDIAPYPASDRVSRMHLLSPDGPLVRPLPQSGENLLVDKTTGKPYPAAPAGALLLSSVPFGWRGIIVERHRLLPAEMPEHTVIGHGISVNVGTQPTSFAWTRGRHGWNDKPTVPFNFAPSWIASHHSLATMCRCLRWHNRLTSALFILRVSSAPRLVCPRTNSSCGSAWNEPSVS